MHNRKIVAVIGGAKISREIYSDSVRIGKALAGLGVITVTGGMSGVMEAVSKGALEEGGLTIGILPGKDKEYANKYLSIPIITAMSHARNAIIVRTGDIVIAIDGKYGTLSEIGLALAIGKKVIGYKTHNIEGIECATTVDEVIALVKKYLAV